MLSHSSSAIEDSWSAMHPGVLDKTLFADAVADFDGDGLFNFEEVGLLLPLPDGGTRPADPGSAHTVHTTLTDGQVAAWQQAILSLPAASPLRSWADADLDGLPDGYVLAEYEFYFYSTACNGYDEDGDGISDLWEYRHSFNLRDWEDWDDDPDGDTLGNWVEFQLGTHPRISDTDGDGFDDGMEYWQGGDPTNRTVGVVTTSTVPGAGGPVGPGDGQTPPQTGTSAQAEDGMVLEVTAKSYTTSYLNGGVVSPPNTVTYTVGEVYKGSNNLNVLGYYGYPNQVWNLPDDDNGTLGDRRSTVYGKFAEQAFGGSVSFSGPPQPLPQLKRGEEVSAASGCSVVRAPGSWDRHNEAGSAIQVLLKEAPNGSGRSYLILHQKQTMVFTWTTFFQFGELETVGVGSVAFSSDENGALNVDLDPGTLAEGIAKKVGNAVEITPRRPAEETNEIISLLPIEVETQTFVSQPSNRERKKIGIGEEVLLQVVSPPDAQVQWSVVAPGKGDVSYVSQGIGKFDAGEKKEKVKVRATLTNYGNATVDTEFDVTIPESIKFEKDWDASGAASNLCNVDLGAYFFFGPDDVSFYNVKGGESEAPPNATGYFDQAPFNTHNHTYWVGGLPNGGDLTRTVVAGKGTKSRIADTINPGATPPYSTGHWHWDIKWLYQLPGHPSTEAGIEFATVRQWCDLTLSSGTPKTITIEGGKGPGDGKGADSAATTGPHTANLP
ncbi:MAG: hypothetical protein ABL962_11885 [Fimbriimonadaceae bacterium]